MVPRVSSDILHDFEIYLTLSEQLSELEPTIKSLEC